MAALLSCKPVLSTGRDIYSKKWLCDLFFNEDSRISPISIHNLGLITRWVRKGLLRKIISLSMRQMFFSLNV